MSRESIIIAIDGGGTHTRVRISMREGRALRERTYEATAKPFVVGADEAARRLALWCADVAQEEFVDRTLIHGVGIGMAGIGNDRDRKFFTQAIRSALAKQHIKPTRLRLETDAAAALVGAFPIGPGIVVIAGTGAILVGRTKKGEVVRVGGWGKSIGDEGSGTWIGTEALRAITRAVDGRSKAPKLIRAFRSAFPQMRALAPRDLRSAISSGAVIPETLAPLVTALALRGDPVSLKITQTAALLLAEQVTALVATHFNTMRAIPLVLHGGVVEYSVIGPLLEETLRRALRGRIRIVEAGGTPLDGAFLFATKPVPRFTI
jgi:N-acetylglucosamine kinase-like BadF-type ATPase